MIYPQSSIDQHTLQRFPRCIPLFHSVHHNPFTSSISCHLRPQVLRKSTSYNGLPFVLACRRTPFPYLEHLITVLSPTFTFNFFLSHTLPNSPTSLHNFSSESATSLRPASCWKWTSPSVLRAPTTTSAVSSAYNSWFT